MPSGTSAARRRESTRSAAFESLAAWKRCGDCAFIPVCGGGCTVASHNELGDMHAPSCHKASFESALAELAQDVAGRG
jgi:radical SAM protein with 4Fe4S-binding SPASM domain